MMFNITQTLSTILPIIATTLLFLVLLITVYNKIRRKFSVSVNCWFCNTWTKVAFENRDGFDCPSCLQYNGFTKDGDYNKIIPEQRDEFMNKGRPSIKSSQNSASNGLCKLCNNNQQLKIFQLAHFVPLVESNYDVEIEHFQEQLEKAYKLCKKCDKVLKKTIGKQNAWIFGKHVKNVCNNGISAVVKISENVKTATPEFFLITIIRLLSITSTILAFLVILSALKLVINFTPKSYIPLLKNVTSSYTVDLKYYYLSKTFKIQPFIAICSFGLFLHILAAFFEKTAAGIKLNRFLCWIILILSSWVNKSYAIQIFAVQVFCCLYLIFSTFSKEETKKPNKKSRSRTMNKIVRNLEKTCSDFSDVSDFEDISTSTQNNFSTASSGSSPRSTYTQIKRSQPLKKSPTASVYNNYASSANDINCSFSTAKSVISTTTINNKRNNKYESLCAGFDNDLNNSLNNLCLDSMGFKQPRLSPVFSVTSVKRPKPVLSPPKFVNSWVAGGGFLPSQRGANLSRSSSESSGFGSQHNDNNFNPFINTNNRFRMGEFEKTQSDYYVNSMAAKSNNSFMPLSQNRTFFPNLNQNNCLFLGGGRNFVSSPNQNNFSSRFSSVSANDDYNFNQSYHKPSLFKNWPENDPSMTFKDLSLQNNSFFRNN